MGQDSAAHTAAHGNNRGIYMHLHASHGKEVHVHLHAPEYRHASRFFTSRYMDADQPQANGGLTCTFMQVDQGMLPSAAVCKTDSILDPHDDCLTEAP